MVKRRIVNYLVDQFGAASILSEVAGAEMDALAAEEYGALTERPNVLAWKASVPPWGTAGSNPAGSALAA